MVTGRVCWSGNACFGPLRISVGLFALWGPQSPLSVLDMRLLLGLCAVSVISQSEACLVTFMKVEWMILVESFHAAKVSIGLDLEILFHPEVTEISTCIFFTSFKLLLLMFPF